MGQIREEVVELVGRRKAFVRAGVGRGKPRVEHWLQVVPELLEPMAGGRRTRLGDRYVLDQTLQHKLDAVSEEVEERLEREVGGSTESGCGERDRRVEEAERVRVMRGRTVRRQIGECAARVRREQRPLHLPASVGHA